MTISSGISDRVNDSDDGDDTWSNTYAEELASLELVPAENPEATEENDEQIREFKRVVHWATGPECESNPRMQRAFYAHFSNKAVSFRYRSSQSSRGHTNRPLARRAQSPVIP
ncbi:hypothetical protein V1522DRAFT_56010 [Lipomyces starkeyi]